MILSFEFQKLSNLIAGYVEINKLKIQMIL